MEINEYSQQMELKNRERFTVNGVLNVVKFAPNEVILRTKSGGIRICGADLKLEDLAKQNGDILITGRVNVINFEDVKEKKNFFKDLLK